ncbi:MAG: ABC transporter substrate-binding protein [Candidatus Rokubacteria bacterium]|nr:ABC transporter substrate-binding protein [Candidatus Rokubacteria bacterium]
MEPREAVASKLKIGGEKNPKLDLIRSLDPDLVLANVEENLKEHVETLRGWGIPVFVQYPRTVADGIRMVEELGVVTGTEERAREIIGELWPLYRQAERLGEARRRAGVFCPIWRNPYMTMNRDTYAHDMLRLCGGQNVFAERSERYPEVTLDEVAAARPEVILLPDEPYRFRKVHVQDFAPYGDVPAVRDGRIHLVDGKLLTWYGPRIGEALQTLPALLHL